MLSYPMTLTPDTNGTFLVQFPDVPEALSVAEDESEALVNGQETLEAAIEIYFDEKRIVPAPSKVKRGQLSITLPALVSAKVLLANEMVSQGVRKAELARRLNVHMPQVDRLVDLRHSSKLENIEQAFHKLGKHIEIRVF
ncbi:type II toxin-antitoxin system HicB family antitoxin [Castellaniella sp.]|uniref:type II toxin-antitoxin system HicB family antitoxin n=1 Tax=Castellaniella sp. TaxID=1955812 RepID=UPI003A8FDDAA